MIDSPRDPNQAPAHTFQPQPAAPESANPGDLSRDIAEVPAVEIISTAALHLLSAAAIKCGLGADSDTHKGSELVDLDEARKLITALAGLVVAGAGELGEHHARPLRDGLRTVQLAFREASLIQDPPGAGPGEKLTGPVT